MPLLGNMQRRIIFYLQQKKGAARLDDLLEEITTAYQHKNRPNPTKAKTSTEETLDRLDVKGYLYFQKRHTPDCTIHLTAQGKEFRYDKLA